MHQSLLVNIHQCHQDLLHHNWKYPHNVLNVRLHEKQALLLYELLQGDPIHVLMDDNNRVSLLVDFLDLHDVRVGQLAQNSDLVFDFLSFEATIT